MITYLHLSDNEYLPSDYIYFQSVNGFIFPYVLQTRQTSTDKEYGRQKAVQSYRPLLRQGKSQCTKDREDKRSTKAVWQCSNRGRLMAICQSSPGSEGDQTWP